MLVIGHSPSIVWVSFTKNEAVGLLIERNVFSFLLVFLTGMLLVVVVVLRAVAVSSPDLVTC